MKRNEENGSGGIDNEALSAIRSEALRLALTDNDSDSGLAQTYWFPSDTELRLIYIDEYTPAMQNGGGISPSRFASESSPGFPYPSSIALIRPEEKDRLSPPAGWGSWDNAEPLLSARQDAVTNGRPESTRAHQFERNDRPDTSWNRRDELYEANGHPGAAYDSLSLIRALAMREAMENKDVDPDLVQVYWFPSDTELRLIYVEADSLPLKEGEELSTGYFGPSRDNGFHYTSAISVIRPEEISQVSPPAGWGSWDEAEPLLEAK